MKIDKELAKERKEKEEEEKERKRFEGEFNRVYRSSETLWH
jgi:predicted secreted protein